MTPSKETQQIIDASNRLYALQRELLEAWVRARVGSEQESLAKAKLDACERDHDRTRLAAVDAVCREAGLK